MQKIAKWLIPLLLMVLIASCVPTATPVPPTATLKPAVAAPTATPKPAEPTAKPKLKIAFVYVAPIGDLGWTWAHEQGRLYLQRHLGDQVETAYIENVPEGPDAERVVRDYASKGYDLIFTTSFGFMDPTIAVAKEFPGKWFVHISGYKTAANVSTVFGAMEEPRYLSGLVAGKATKTGKIGYVAAFPIPEVIRGINAFALGVRAANPSATVTVIWTSTWYDPVKEKEAATALLDAGCDVIAQHQDTTEPQKAAQERGKLSIGYDSDMAKFVGDTVLTSPVWNWGPKYVDIAKKVMAGTYKSESYYGGMKDGIVDLAPLSVRASDDAKKLVEEKKKQILAGWSPFTGPISGQTGLPAVSPGRVMPLDELLTMDWFVQGVVGEAPGKAPVVPFVVTFGLADSWTDEGWNAAHWRGIEELKSLGEVTEKTDTSFTVKITSPKYPELKGGLLKVNVVTNIGYSGADIERKFGQAIQTQNPSLVFATYWDSKDAAVSLANKYPNILFEHCSGYPAIKSNDKNLATYFIAIEDTDYVVGYVAGRLGIKRVGVVNTHMIPEPVRGVNAFALGQKRGLIEAGLDPKDQEVRVIWIKSWLDMALEKQAAESLLSAGFMAIRQMPDTPTVSQTTCEVKGAVAFGYGTDVQKKAPCAALTNEWRWGPYYRDRVLAAMSGKWTTHDWYESFAANPVDDAVRLVGWNVKPEIRAAAEKVVAEIRAGFDIFTGPIEGYGLGPKGEKITISVPKGMKVGTMGRLTMQWFVNGVASGELPTYPPDGHQLYLEPVKK